MTNWHTLLPGLSDDPVVGEVGDYAAAASEARRVGRTCGDVVDEFGRIARGDALTEIRGATADALADVIREVDRSLADAPPVFERLDQIFAAHAERLRALRNEASAALARACLRRTQRDDAEVRLEGARTQLRAIDDQLWWLRSADPELHAERIEALQHSRWSQARRVDQAGRSLATADDELESSRVEHGRLVESSYDLIDDTVRALLGVELGDLADPNGVLDRLGAFGAAAWDALGGLVRDATGLALEALGVMLDGLVTVAGAVFEAALTGLAVALGVVLLAGAAIAATLAIAAIVALAVVLVPIMTLVLLADAVGLIELPTRSNRSDDDGGDQGGTYTTRPTLDWAFAGDAEIGRTVLTTALAHTGDVDLIQADEFEIVTIEAADGSRQHVVVLAGVTDLSRPQLGWNPHHRSVRDVDQGALSSSTSTGIDGNPYAAMVYQAMVLHGVAPGDRVMLVGHSYGADTALDLAADPRFNGPGAFDVTHVHAAGYHSGPQMRFVPAGTEVLATQNAADLVVQGEMFGYDLVGSVDSYADATGTLLGGDLLGGMGDLGRFTVHAGALDDPLERQLETLVPGERVVAPGQTRIVFSGGSDRAGHDPSHYIEFLDTHSSDAVAAFEASVGAAGYGGPGVMHAIDVSVPESGVPSLSGG